MTRTKNIIIIGATSSIAEHCARQWLADGASGMVLVGRDQARLERVAADQRVRSLAASVHVVVADFQDPAAIDRSSACRRFVAHQPRPAQRCAAQVGRLPCTHFADIWRSATDCTGQRGASLDQNMDWQRPAIGDQQG